MRHRRWFVAAALLPLTSGIAALTLHRHPASPRAHAKGLASVNPDDSVQIAAAPGSRDSAGGISPDLFGMPPPKPAPPPPPPKPAPPPPAPAQDPLADWTFTGFATLDGKQYGLLENRKTHVGRFVLIGDEVEGFRIDGMGRTGMRLLRAGEAREIAMNAKFDLVPLDKSAEYLGGGAYKHENAEVADTYVHALARVYDGRFHLVSSSLGADTAKLTNDMFEGKISPEEFDRRKGGSEALYFGAVDSGSVVSFRLSTALTDAVTTEGASVTLTYQDASKH